MWREKLKKFLDSLSCEDPNDKSKLIINGWSEDELTSWLGCETMAAPINQPPDSVTLGPITKFAKEPISKILLLLNKDNSLAGKRIDGHILVWHGATGRETWCNKCKSHFM